MADHPNQIDKSPFAYGWNNPISLNDPDGNCPNCATAGIGFVVGGIIGGAASAIGQLTSGDEFSFTEVAKAAGAGAVGGAFVGSGAGVLASMGGFASAGAGGVFVAAGTGVASGIASETTAQALDMVDGAREVGDFNSHKIAESGALGGGLNIVSAGVGQYFKKPVTDAASKLFSSDVAKSTIRTAQKGAKRAAKQSGLSGKQLRGVAANRKTQVKENAVKSAVQKTNVVSQSGVNSIGTSLKNAIIPFLREENN